MCHDHNCNTLQASTPFAWKFNKHNGQPAFLTGVTSSKIALGTQSTHPRLLSFGWASWLYLIHTSVHTRVTPTVG